MQLACVLHMVPGWKKTTVVRVFMCIDSKIKDGLVLHRQWEQMLNMLRIEADIHVVIPPDLVTSPSDQSMSELSSSFQSSANQAPIGEDSGVMSQNNTSYNQAQFDDGGSPSRRFEPSETYLRSINGMIQEHSAKTAVVFLYLPPPPANVNDNILYFERLNTLTNNLPPTLLVHGINPVTSTTL